MSYVVMCKTNLLARSTAVSRSSIKRVLSYQTNLWGYKTVRDGKSGWSDGSALLMHLWLKRTKCFPTQWFCFLRNVASQKRLWTKNNRRQRCTVGPKNIITPSFMCKFQMLKWFKTWKNSKNNLFYSGMQVSEGTQLWGSTLMKLCKLYMWLPEQYASDLCKNIIFLHPKKEFKY